VACSQRKTKSIAFGILFWSTAHGRWRWWKGVYDILVKDGYSRQHSQEPETSFKDDVAATKRVLTQQDGPCILVGHSYGGAVITEAGTDSSVAGLVYIAATCPMLEENEADDESASQVTSASLAR